MRIRNRLAIAGVTAMLALSTQTGPVHAATGTFTWTPQWMSDDKVTHTGETVTLTDPVKDNCYKLTGHEKGSAQFSNDTDRKAIVYRGSDTCDGNDTWTVGVGEESSMAAPERVSVSFWTTP